MLDLSEAAPRIREELRHPTPEVRLAAIWALGRLRDDGAREALVALLRQLSPSGGATEMFAQGDGDGAVRLLSDAADRLYDTTIQAIGRLRPQEGGDVLLVRALTESRAALPEEMVDRPARLPNVEVPPGTTPPTLGQLFEAALPLGPDEDEIGC
jgi:hypothetical protein